VLRDHAVSIHDAGTAVQHEEEGIVRLTGEHVDLLRKAVDRHFPFEIDSIAVHFVILTEYLEYHEHKNQSEELALLWVLGLAGQLCWSVEGSWFNSFVYDKISNDPSIAAWMV
jgi:hypothetical protein